MKIKQLEWGTPEEYETKSVGGEHLYGGKGWTAVTPWKIITYRIDSFNLPSGTVYAVAEGATKLRCKLGSLEEAKAVAQADYEKRVSQALEPSQPIDDLTATIARMDLEDKAAVTEQSVPLQTLKEQLGSNLSFLFDTIDNLRGKVEELEYILADAEDENVTLEAEVEEATAALRGLRRRLRKSKTRDTVDEVLELLRG